MQPVSSLDRAGRRRSPATLRELPPKASRPGTRGCGIRRIRRRSRRSSRSCAPRGEGLKGVRLRGIIVTLWRAGLRISEALALNETDLDPDRGSLLVRHAGGGDKRREVGMDRWAWEQLQPWIESAPHTAGRCVLLHPARSHARPAACGPASIRAQLHRTAATRRGQAPVRAASAPARSRR